MAPLNRAEKARHSKALTAANAYAPAPIGSALTYGLIAASLLVAGAIIAAAFFEVDVHSDPLSLGIAAAVAFCFGFALRLWKKKTHTRAVATEYALDSPVAGDADPASPVSPKGPSDSSAARGETRAAASKWVTFHATFDLPGLDRPHPPGSFEVRITREPLDVSWSAFRIHQTIMLTESGAVEALEVSQADLAAALSRDADAAPDRNHP